MKQDMFKSSASRQERGYFDQVEIEGLIDRENEAVRQERCGI